MLGAVVIVAAVYGVPWIRQTLNTVSTDDAFIKLQYDLYYVKNRSFALDIAILLRTVKVVVLQQGAV